MPRPKYTSEGVRPRASRQFTDREEFIGAFEKAASELPLEEHKVLVYYGVGGIGKTTLRKELCRRLEERRPEVGWAVLDFGEMVLGSEHPETAISLNNLAKLLREQGRYGEAEPLLERAEDPGERVGSQASRYGSNATSTGGLLGKKREMTFVADSGIMTSSAKEQARVDL